eukprot:TRINITY_DN41511_c0_g1_i1.p1 TRINITY_DN41511_c0_g1~~TRINITY_DN41511_c0_g1_i1.p1  ORF type:complete len:335 (-),score=53.86 TRINITY_DN41511_c0_g1_i1:94-1098(-)
MKVPVLLVSGMARNFDHRSMSDFLEQFAEVFSEQWGEADDSSSPDLWCRIAFKVYSAPDRWSEILAARFLLSVHPGGKSAEAQLEELSQYEFECHFGSDEDVYDNYDYDDICNACDSTLEQVLDETEIRWSLAYLRSVHGLREVKGCGGSSRSFVYVLYCFWPLEKEYIAWLVSSGAMHSPTSYARWEEESGVLAKMKLMDEWMAALPRVRAKAEHQGSKNLSWDATNQGWKVRGRTRNKELNKTTTTTKFFSVRKYGTRDDALRAAQVAAKALFGEPPKFRQSLDWIPKKKSWRARLREGQKYVWCNHFSKRDDAVKAMDEAIEEHRVSHQTQ